MNRAKFSRSARFFSIAPIFLRMAEYFLERRNFPCQSAASPSLNAANMRPSFTGLNRCVPTASLGVMTANHAATGLNLGVPEASHGVTDLTRSITVASLSASPAKINAASLNLTVTKASQNAPDLNLSVTTKNQGDFVVFGMGIVGEG